MDEVYVRASLALENKKFVNEFELSTDATADAGELEQEYDAMCIEIDKVTLKLFFTLVQGGKLECAYDLSQRLHNEKSFNVAITAADRCGQQKLSDRIHDLMEERFREDLVEEEDVSDDESLAMDNAPTEETVVHLRRVSPNAVTKRKEREEDVEASSEVPEPANKVRRRLNPFAKTHKESPPKAMMESPQAKKPTLSRMSTFSAESRQKSKLAKHFL